VAKLGCSRLAEVDEQLEGTESIWDLATFAGTVDPAL